MRLRTVLFIPTLMILMGAASLISSQEAGYLSQKLLLENTIQQRVTDAVSKILDESLFVVDVKVELGFTPTRQTETVYRDASGRLIRVAEAVIAEPGEEAATRSVTSPFPIPGFPDIVEEVAEPVRPLDEVEAGTATDEGALSEGEPAAGAEVTATLSETIGGLPNIESLAINIILEDGVSPQTIENVRQVALIASRFDRDRGDLLSITTASFKDRRPPSEMLAEADLLPTTIQIDQTNALQDKLREAEARNEELMQELRARELEYLQRSEEERKQALSDLAQVQNERARDLIFLQQQREEQNTRMQEALLTQLDEMRKDLTSGRLPQEEQDIITLQAASLEDSLDAMRMAFAGERERLQAQIEAALNREPPPSKGLGGLDTSTLIIVLAVVLVLIVLMAVLLSTSRSRAQGAPVGMVYPGPVAPPYPRRRPIPRAAPPKKRVKKKKAPPAEPEDTDAEEPETKETKEAPTTEEKAPSPEISAAQPAEAFDAAPSQVDEDPEVLRSEVKSIRQSVVSMSVGRPESATRILSNWLQQEAPSAAEAEESAPDEVEEAAPGGSVADALRDEREKES